MRRRILLLVAAVIILALVVTAGRLMTPTETRPMPGGPPPAAVETAVATMTPLEVTVRATGTVEAAEQITVTALASGLINRILFREGQQVAAGDVLVELDAGRQQAALQGARAEAREAQRQIQRLEELVATRAVAQSEVDAARARLETAQAGVAETQAALQERFISAPFSGVVGLRAVSLGALVEPGSAITTLATLDRLKLAFTLPAELLPRLAEGLELRARAPGFDADYSGRVVRIDNTVNPATRSVALEAELADGERLRPGVFVAIEVVLESREGVVVPEAAVVLEGTQAHVYTVGEDGVADRREVTVGERRRGLAEIREGVQADEWVITAGAQNVRPGQPVRILGADGTAAPEHQP